MKNSDADHQNNGAERVIRHSLDLGSRRQEFAPGGGGDE
jgi:hypothetical protein